MDLQNKAKQLLDLLQRNPPILGQASKQAAAAEKALDALIAAMLPWDRVNWLVATELESAVSAIGKKAIPGVNRRLAQYGVAFRGGLKSDKQEFLRNALKSSRAAEILAELRRKEPNPVEERFYELARLGSGVATRLQGLPDSDLKAMLKYLKVREPKKSPSRKAFDRHAALDLISERVRDAGLRIRH